MAIIHSLSPGFKNQVSGVGCQVSGEKNVRAETQKPRMKLHQNGIVSFSIKLAAFQASGGGCKIS